MDPLYGGNSLKRPRVDDGAPPPMPSGGPPMGMMPPPPAGYGVGAPMQQPMYGGAYGQPPPPMGVMGGVGGGYGGGFMGDGGMPSMQPPPYGGMPPSMPPQMQIPPPPSYHMPPQPLGPMPPPMPPPVTPQLRGQYLRRALEALSKEALIKMFTDVALKHGGTVFDAIYNAACTDTVRAHCGETRRNVTDKPTSMDAWYRHFTTPTPPQKTGEPPRLCAGCGLGHDGCLFEGGHADVWGRGGGERGAGAQHGEVQGTDWGWGREDTYMATLI